VFADSSVEKAQCGHSSKVVDVETMMPSRLKNSQSTVVRNDNEYLQKKTYLEIL
jgi:hypothetical protein